MQDKKVSLFLSAFLIIEVHWSLHRHYLLLDDQHTSWRWISAEKTVAWPGLGIFIPNSTTHNCLDIYNTYCWCKCLRYTNYQHTVEIYVVVGPFNTFHLLCIYHHQWYTVIIVVKHLNFHFHIFPTCQFLYLVTRVLLLHTIGYVFYYCVSILILGIDTLHFVVS